MNKEITKMKKIKITKKMKNKKIKNPPPITPPPPCNLYTVQTKLQVWVAI